MCQTKQQLQEQLAAQAAKIANLEALLNTTKGETNNNTTPTLYNRPHHTQHRWLVRINGKPKVTMFSARSAIAWKNANIFTANANKLGWPADCFELRN